MFDYGGAPSTDEVEVTLFGPGFGEAIAVHIGNGEWLLIDSCTLPDTGEPASLHYLQALEVPLDRVKGVVASHWHQDHVAGLSTITAQCPQAQLWISDAFTNAEGLAFLEGYNEEDSGGTSRGTKELYQAILSVDNNRRRRAHQQTIIYERRDDVAVRVSVFAPTHGAVNQTLARLSSYIPAEGHDRNDAPPELAPNLEAIVLHIQVADLSILLGSDLENHPTNGWANIVNDPWIQGFPRASLYKVAHHGSTTAEHPGIWTGLLQPQPLSVVTPFRHGRVKLPTDPDALRIKGVSSALHQTSYQPPRTMLPKDIEDKMVTIATTFVPQNAGFGAVRARRRLHEAEWRVEHFGHAAKR